MRNEIKELLRTAPIFDGHNDLPWALRGDGFASLPESVDLGVLAADCAAFQLHTDIPRLREGGVGAQFWSVYAPTDIPPSESVVYTLEQIDLVRRMVDRFPEVFELVASSAGVRAAFAAGRVASLLGIEGGHSIDSSLGVLREMRRTGVGYMTLTHNDSTPWACSATDPGPDFGLTDLGRQVVAEMNRIGMLVDLSHVAPRTMHDALDCTAAPVIFSHSSCRAVTDHPRNVADDVLERLGGNGGVLMINFVPAFVSQECADHRLAAAAQRRSLGLTVVREELVGPADGLAEYDRWMRQNPRPVATIADVLRHFEHARDVVGIDHIGIGADFDGTDELPEGISDVSDHVRVIEALSAKGWSVTELAKVTSGNILRVLEQSERLAAAS